MVNSPVEGMPGEAGRPPQNESRIAQEREPTTLYITLGPEGTFKAGTCQHCVVYEHGRPERAWSVDGDSALDFDRDTLFAYLSELGIVFTNRQAYVCP